MCFWLSVAVCTSFFNDLLKLSTAVLDSECTGITGAKNIQLKTL